MESTNFKLNNLDLDFPSLFNFRLLLANVGRKPVALYTTTATTQCLRQQQQQFEEEEAEVDPAQEGAPLSLHAATRLQGVNSIGFLNFGQKTGHETGPSSGPHSVLGHSKFRYVSKLQK